MLARMKQDMGSTPKVSEAPGEGAALPLLPEQAPPGHARKPSLGADATPRSSASATGRKGMVSSCPLLCINMTQLLGWPHVQGWRPSRWGCAEDRCSAGLLARHSTAQMIQACLYQHPS